MDTDLKQCRRCNEMKPATSTVFKIDPRVKSGLSTMCRACHQDYERTRRLATLYNVTRDQYDEMLVAQGGVCAMCLKAPKQVKSLAVEHNHRTNVVHGLACQKCNHMLLGVHGRDPDFYRRVAEFLENPPAAAVLGADHRVPATRPKVRRKRR